MKRASITKSFSSLLVAPDEPPAATRDALDDAPAPPRSRVPAGVVGATEKMLLADLRHERDELRARLAATAETTLDTSLIDPSPFPDRLEGEDAEAFAAFRDSIARGQTVPIQVRPHPKAAGRYQVVYGHRRLRAATELGIRIKAQIVEVDDHQLAVAQGLENSARQDLTWIERAHFAGRLMGARIKPAIIKAALHVSDSEMSKYRHVLEMIPRDIVEMIGRAPGIGRPRWLALADHFAASSDNAASVRKTLAADKVSALPSDARFKAAVGVFEAKPKNEAGSRFHFAGPTGADIGWMERVDEDLRLRMAKSHRDSFEVFLKAEMPALLERFFARKGADDE